MPSIIKPPGICPVCNHELQISKLSCTYCQTKLEGEFTTCKFCGLPAEQREFIEVFIKCRGNIKDVEKELGISYPTVRNRLNGVIEALVTELKKQILRKRKNNARSFWKLWKRRNQRRGSNPPASAEKLKRSCCL